MTDLRMGPYHDPSFHALFRDGSMIGWSDADLVRGFASDRGESSDSAFAALVARHGPMVLAVCRRILRDEHAAEDAFQAVFLLLARKAHSVSVDDSLGRWLHGVTKRIAVRRDPSPIASCPRQKLRRFDLSTPPRPSREPKSAS